jgi:glycosyltransferase involved in cell wall biosynthesis
MSRPKVLFVSSSLTVGGAERQWSLLIPALRNRFDVSLLTLVGEGPFFDELRDLGIPVSCAHMRHRADVRGLRRALSSGDIHPQLVVTQSINADVVGHLIARRARAAHLTNEHRNVGTGAPASLHRDALNRLLAPHLDGSIIVSDVQVPTLLRLGFRHTRLRLIRNGVPVPIPATPRSVVRASLGLQDDHFLALMVAALRPEKNAEGFVEAVRKARGVDPRIRGAIAGAGPQLERLRALTQDDDVVRILGERHDVPDLLTAADAACLSSTAEGVPMALLEAMALARPVVATNVGGVAEAVVSGVTGLLVDAGDVGGFAEALVRLARDPELMLRLGEGGKRRQKELFGVDRMIDEYALAFEEAIESRFSLVAARAGTR